MNALTRKGVLLCVLISGLIGPKKALAGPSGTGGGKVVVCIENGRRTVETLDFWEARRRHPKWVFRKSNDPVKKQIAEALKRMEFGNEFPVELSSVFANAPAFRMRELIQIGMAPLLTRQIKNEKGQFIRKVTEVRGNVGLELTPDSYEEIHPTGNCQIKQAIRYNSHGDIVVQQDLLDAMDRTNLAAQYLHEGTYFALRHINEQSSLRTRRIVSYIMSCTGDCKKPGTAHVLKSVASGVDSDAKPGTGRILCESPTGKTRVGFYLDKDSVIRSFAIKIAGLQLIDFSPGLTGVSGSGNLEAFYSNYLASSVSSADQQCTGQFGFGDGYKDSVVDSETEFWIKSTCSGDQRSVNAAVSNTPDGLNNGLNENVVCKLVP